MANDDFEEILNSDWFKERDVFLKEKSKDIVNKPNAIHIAYYSNLISRDEIRSFELELNQNDLELSSYDQLGDITANYNFFQLDFYVLISSFIFESIVSGIVSNATWELIKLISAKLSTKISSHKNEEISMGVKIKQGKHHEISFDFKGIKDEKTIFSIMDKIPTFMNLEYKSNPIDIMQYVYYDKKKKKWIQISPIEEIKRNKKK